MQPFTLVFSKRAIACASHGTASHARFCQHQRVSGLCNTLRPLREAPSHTRHFRSTNPTALGGSRRGMASTLQSPAFTQAVVQAMRKLYPEELADRSWDNVGLLQENIDPSHHLSPFEGKPMVPTVLLTNDLTLRVAEEAIRKQASVIVTYRRFIRKCFLKHG
jgi:hypothetical protein